MLKTEYSDALLLTKMELQREKIARRALLEENAILRKRLSRYDDYLQIAFILGGFAALFFMWSQK